MTSMPGSVGISQEGRGPSALALSCGWSSRDPQVGPRKRSTITLWRRNCWSHECTSLSVNGANCPCSSPTRWRTPSVRCPVSAMPSCPRKGSIASPMSAAKQSRSSRASPSPGLPPLRSGRGSSATREEPSTPRRPSRIAGSSERKRCALTMASTSSLACCKSSSSKPGSTTQKPFTRRFRTMSSPAGVVPSGTGNERSKPRSAGDIAACWWPAR
mmetsp:Transcript_19382/g.42327  ORF Transcript_19382/g.42327 Transcript_19382/m.42327 type:complete len:215 (+) Transcript_19382:2158-2802(+)